MNPEQNKQKPRYWRSVEEYRDGDDRPRTTHGYPELVGREFPIGATEMDGATRRDFLKLVGLTAAGSMAACMRNPPERVLPYTRQPADMRPGLPLHYATATSLDGFGMGLLVTSREGRPIKVEGNPDHPSSRGASGTFEQGLAYGVYDPQRGKRLRRSGEQSGWKSFLSEIRERIPAWQQNGGQGVRFLDGPTASPLDAWLRAQVKAVLPNARWSTYAALSRDAVYQGTQIAFGAELEPRLDFDKARVILALDDDFLEHGPDRLAHARAFAAHRVPEPESAEDAAQTEGHDESDPNSRGERAAGEGSQGSAEGGGREGPQQWMNRLYVAECDFSVTGVAADHRLRVRGSDIAALAAALYAEIAPAEAGELGSTAGSFRGHKWVKAVAKDLVAHRQQAVVTVGPRQPAEVHAVVAAINAALGSEVVRYKTPALLDTKSGPAALAEIVAAANQGQIETLVITAWNPVYTCPTDIAFAESLRKIPNVIYFGLFEDETSDYARWYVPAAHDLESWGDTANADGVLGLQQPLIAPLFGGIQRAELFAAFAGKAELGAYQLLKEAHAARLGGADKANFESMWERMLQTGVILPAPSDRAEQSTPVAQAAQAVATLKALKVPQGTSLELNFVVDNKVYDGRFGDNAWLQELPNSLTKVTWGNTALVSPKTAERLGVEAEQIVTLDVGGRQIDAPIYVLPGHADDALSIALGYGRQGAEIIARGVGANAYRLRSTKAAWFGVDVKLADTGKRDRLGITQEHWAMEGRPIALVADVESGQNRLAKNKRLKLIEDQNDEGGEPQPSMQHAPEEQTYTSQSGDGYRWAMAIDMSKCTGCNACILACESENNILIVGKDQIRRGREMHWLRIDRYFEGDLADPQVVTQPMACVQCEKAPCEYVCPVNATVHSEEGLNDMVYNRCVGTRYCANNCPYKVRRFNYLNWHNNLQGTLEMKMNPDVTVRSRGVIEKCTYCVQRIEQARIGARIAEHGKGRMLRDGEVITACQQSCASGAISFGSLHDPHSVVSKKHKDERAYQVLWELNTRPRTRHLAKVRNLNSELVTKETERDGEPT
jgi:molybdopterin-containing oxidoreductase family iron-sulfur binding subunit